MSRWRRKTAATTPPQQERGDAPQRSAETERALRAARDAAVQLDKTRRLRRRVDETADAIERENSKNGFRLLIEEALGGKA
jgi:hypothetical protein